MKVTRVDPYYIHIEGDVNPDTHMYIRMVEGDVVESKVVENGTEEMFYKKTSIEGIYTFGCKQLTDSWDHKAGYVWSTRASCVNDTFGTNFVGCIYNSTYCAIDADIAKPMVEEFYGCPCVIKVTRDGKVDLNYRIVKASEQ